MGAYMRIRDRASRSVERAVTFLADTWVFLTVGVFLFFLLFVVSAGWEYWSEQTVRNGTVVEIKTDRARIIQQTGVVLLAVPALLFAVWRSWTAHQHARSSIDQARIAAENAKRAARGQNAARY